MLGGRHDHLYDLYPLFAHHSLLSYGTGKPSPFLGMKPPAYKEQS